MTPQQRISEFNRLFELIPGKNDSERIDVVCDILFCKPNTIRIYRMKEPSRVIPERSIKILRKYLEPQQKQ